MNGERCGGGVLVDTCMWIDFFRKDTTTAQALVGLVQDGRAVVAGVVIYELMQGIRSDKERSTIKGVLSGLDYAEMSPEVWEAAADLARTLKRKGQTIPMSDILLGAIAITYKLSVFTIDSHFDTIPGLKRYLPG